MNAVWKFKLGVAVSDIEMPIGAKVLRVGVQGYARVIWAQVDPDAAREMRRFVAVGTGWPFDASGHSYIGTIEEGPFVWHVFEEEIT